MQDNNVRPDPQALKNKFEELQERATKDALSGLLNRATAEAYINERLSGMNEGDICALFIIDLDNFKKINDTLGHQAGDQAIRQSARILSAAFRATDIVGRLGGDEFMAFWAGPLTESLIRRKARELCERLQLMLGRNPSMPLTASVGVRIASGKGISFDEMYQAADLALYKAKKNGKRGFYVKHSEELAEGDDGFLPVNTITLSGLLENMDSGVALLEMCDQPRLIYVSPSFCRLMGVNIQSYPLPRQLSSIIHPDDWVSLMDALRGGLARGETVEHTHRVSADGQSWLWWRIRAIKTEYGSAHPVMLVTASDVSRYKESEQRLQEMNSRLLSAFEQTTQSMWEVDIQKKTVTIFSCVCGEHSPRDVHGAFPDFLLANGWVHPSSIPRFREFAGDLLGGKSHGYGNFVLQYQDTGCYGWAALSYKQLCDELGRPAKAVGILERLPQEFPGQERSSGMKRAFPEALGAHLIVGLQANLTRDSVDELWFDGRELSGRAAETSCDSILKGEAGRFFSPDDRQTLSAYFDRRQLIHMFESGERWLAQDYRRVDDDGNIRWVTSVINLTREPLTQNVCLFWYLMQSDLCRQRELELGIEAVRDAVTGLYDRATARAMIERQMARSSFHEYAIAMIQLGGLERLCTENGSAMNQPRYCLAAALTVALGPTCVIGQYSRDKFVAFFPNVHALSDMKRQLEHVFSFMRLALADMHIVESLRFVAGVAGARSGRASYQDLVAQAAQLCQLWHNAATDTVALPQETEDWSWSELQHAGEGDQITIGRDELRRPLSEREKDVAFQCVSAMLASDSLDTSIRSVLNCIGEYYRADRVYVLMLAENRHVVTMPYEWTSSKKPSIQQAVTGMFVERFPIIKRCMEEQSPILLTRMRSFSSDEPLACGDGRWHFTTFPLMDEGVIVGFLCIENPQNHPTDAALFTTLIPYIIGEQKRFHSSMQIPGDTPNMYLSELPNLRSYMNVIYSINSDVYSAMGAVCLDIPGLSSINSNQGFEYGSRMLWYVSKALADIFGNSFIFRTWDAEFVALCPDTTRQVFVGRCTRLRSTLQRRYPKELRMGYTWSEGVFSGKTLVNEARAIMRCESVAAALDPEAMNSELKNVSEAARLGRFVIYLQPKINMLTGALMGAEALVRGLDDAGHIVPPDRFVGRLESSGDIRDLDLYVLDLALAEMDRWIDLGLKPVPVSVNFSRITLFDPAALASVLAIQSRYPRLPPELLELEITERGLSVEGNSLAEVLERFREFGIRFALDDFGSKYANISIFTSVRFDCVKLDRSLISQLADNPRARILTRDLVNICHSSDMLCVAEGVETKAQIAALTEFGCACGQGYYFDRPLPAKRFMEKYLRPAQAD